MDAAPADTAGVIAPPPVLYFGTLAATLLLGRRRPARLLPPRVARPVGLGLLASGFVLGGWAARTMLQAGTPLDPAEPVTAIVTAGPYQYSRNPIYAGMALIYLGAAALANSRWPVIVLPALLQVVQRGVIEREERYLEQRFGDEYRRYQASVRRWL
ncbi:MAG TPA: isoprenylcysteine carboxylmethyltransferase family protein [Thermomicrobiales bacterium]|nr:isoprenylcysteine carboxylmethyltransferase family protein [Thermomicrobiales bacterium]